MDTTTIGIIAGVALVFAAVVFIFTTSVRRDRSTAEKIGREQEAAVTEGPQSQSGTGREVERLAVADRRAEVAKVAGTNVVQAGPVYVDEEVLAVTRRQFFNRGILTMVSLGLGGFGAASIAFLWPSGSGGFGSKISVGKLDDILATIRDTREPVYVPEGRFYIQPYPTEAIGKAKNVSAYEAALPGMEEGVVALYQKCVHLGCRVPWCKTSQWFECPCHGSQYNRVGEKKGGPAPRGLDRFVVSVSGGSVTVDTGQVVGGPPIGTNTTGQEAEGPHCA